MLTKITSFIDSISTAVANIVMWLVLILALINFYEVIMRYVFNNPSMWVYDMSYMIGGTFFTLGMAYTLLKGIHVRVDVLYTKYKKRTKALLDTILTLIVFFPTFGLLLVKLVPWVMTSWERKERATGSFWLPPIYPFKTIMLIAVILLILQMINEFIKNIMILTNKDEQKEG